MDPISATLGIVGLGMQIYGGMKSSEVAGQEAKVSQDEATQEQGINDAKQAAMELNGRRTQMENVRNVQRARALAENTGVGQNAQFGSGLAGGLAQITDQGLFNMSGVNSALQTGRQINSFNQNITSDKKQMAALGGTMATDQGIASLGGAIMKAGPMVGQMGQAGMSFAKDFSSLMGPGSLSGGLGS